jgi:hypothetical protein
MEKHLKPYQYYSDLYDKFTVEHCRGLEKIDYEVKLPKYKGKEIPKENQPGVIGAFSKMHMFFETGERYLEKSKRISEWMERDKKYDELYEEAKAPENITCLTCGRLMFVESKYLDFGDKNKRDRVMFFYDCPLKHKPMRVFYDDGEERRSEPHLCPKCNSNFNEEAKREKDIIYITYTCIKCGFIEETNLDLTPKKEKIDPDFIRDRNRFCLSEADGQKYIEGKANIENLGKLIDSFKEKEKNKDLYNKVAKLKKLKIIELEKLLAPILESNSYVRLQFQTPEVGKDVFVPFIVYDSKSERTEYDSKHNLQKLLKNNLENTNWRLMSDGVNYRLGMLEGRLRAYEKEEDLVKLITEK